MLEKAERDRTIDFGRKFPDKFLAGLVKEQFGVDFSVPQGYKLRAKGDDFLWISYEFPQASQGFFIYSYGQTGVDGRSADRGAQPVRGSHPRSVGRLLHDYGRRLRA
mgnify:FL=1